MRLRRGVRRLIGRAAGAWTRRDCAREFASQTVTRLNERPVELAFVFRHMARLYPRRVLDVGTGTTALPHVLRHCGPHVTAIDNVRDYWPAGTTNRHYHVIDDDITRSRIEGRYDLVLCVSVLEHIEASDAAVRNMLGLLAPGGHLILTFPYTESGYVRNVYELPGSTYGAKNRYITQSFSRRNLDGWLAASGARVVEQEYWRFWDGGHWTVGSQVIPPRLARADEPHELSCVLLASHL